jgi:quinol-cytochrome oxidoreductase complex cytochrome b subunit
MVITSLFYSLPQIGTDFILLLWGGFTIDDVTLHRFYSLHFALPFVIFFVTIIHLAFAHEGGANNPLGLPTIVDSVPFSPYYVIKDTVTLIVVLLFFLGLVFTKPDMLGHPDNFMRANFLVTPTHIVPEWYFLPLYAVLRSVVSKLLGIFLLFCFFFVLFMLPFYLFIIIRSSTFKPLNSIAVFCFFAICL